MPPWKPKISWILGFFFQGLRFLHIKTKGFFIGTWKNPWILSWQSTYSVIFLQIAWFLEVIFGLLKQTYFLSYFQPACRFSFSLHCPTLSPNPQGEPARRPSYYVQRDNKVVSKLLWNAAIFTIKILLHYNRHLFFCNFPTVKWFKWRNCWRNLGVSVFEREIYLNIPAYQDLWEWSMYRPWKYL